MSAAIDAGQSLLKMSSIPNQENKADSNKQQPVDLELDSVPCLHHYPYSQDRIFQRSSPSTPPSPLTSLTFFY